MEAIQPLEYPESPRQGDLARVVIVKQGLTVSEVLLLNVTLHKNHHKLHPNLPGSPRKLKPTVYSLSSEELLWNAAWLNSVPRVRQLLKDPSINFNKENQTHHSYTPLHIAAELGHTEVVKELLRQPRVSVNPVSDRGASPFLLACCHGRIQVVMEMLRHPRLNVNKANSQGLTPLWAAACNGHLEVVRRLVLSGRHLEVGAKYSFDGTTPLEIAQSMGHTKVSALLEELARDPKEARRNLMASLSSELFATTIFLCDDYLGQRQEQPEKKEEDNAKRFFNIATKLPMDIQMLLCNRTFSSPKDVLCSADTEKAFRTVGMELSQTPGRERTKRQRPDDDNEEEEDQGNNGKDDDEGAEDGPEVDEEGDSCSLRGSKRQCVIS